MSLRGLRLARTENELTFKLKVILNSWTPKLLVQTRRRQTLFSSEINKERTEELLVNLTFPVENRGSIRST